MDNQPKYRAQSESQFFYDGATMQAPVEGTVARGDWKKDDPVYGGKNPDGSFVQIPLEVDEALLQRGSRQYGIFCVPCHGERADGRSVFVERSGVRIADLSELRIREMEDGRIFETITNGVGLMPGYRYPIPPEDRWAIIAHLRRLQGTSD